VIEAMESSLRTVPAHLTLDPATFSGQYVERPTLESVSWPIEIKIAEICDFLAHTT
jgi:small subunit ribosomal protein S4